MQAREELEIVTARLLSVRGVTSVVGEHILEKIKKRVSFSANRLTEERIIPPRKKDNCTLC